MQSPQDVLVPVITYIITISKPYLYHLANNNQAIITSYTIEFSNWIAQEVSVHYFRVTHDLDSTDSNSSSKGICVADADIISDYE